MSMQNGGMMLSGEEPEIMRAKPTPLLLHPPQIPHAMSWQRISSYAMPGRRQTAWVRPHPISLI